MNLHITNKILLALLVIVTIILYGHALFFAEVSLDAGYYLGLAQQIVRGKLLYKDILNNYTPLAMYYFAGVMGLFGEAYPVLLLSLFSIIFLGAFLLYRCLKTITHNKWLSLILSFLYLVANYYYDASYIYLEPFVNLFGLASVYCLLIWEKKEQPVYLFLAGVCSCMAFLSKQYGIIYVVFSGIYAAKVYVERPGFNLNTVLKDYLLLGAGALSPVLILLLLYSFFGISPDNFLNSLIMKAYADESVANYLKNTGSFLLQNCSILLLLPVLIYVKSVNRRSGWYQVWGFLILLLLFTSIYYVKIFPHYSLLLLPAAFLVIAPVYKMIAEAKEMLLQNAFLLLIWFSAAFTSIRAGASFLENQRTWNREKQLAIAAEINKILPPGSKALLISDFYYYYLCRLEPYAPAKYGYCFFGGLLPAQQQELLTEASAILLHKRFQDQYLKQLQMQVTEVNNSDLLVVRKPE